MLGDNQHSLSLDTIPRLHKQKVEKFVTSSTILDAVWLKQCFMGVTNAL